ncbi:MAG: glycerol kinase [Pseudomonadota bacterium]
MAYLLALDQGTSSSRAIVFQESGEVVASAQKEFQQHFPQPGWVEHDPMEIWESQLSTLREALHKAQLRASDIARVGITNQRETTLVWHRRTGQPIHNAIVWQDRRTEAMCDSLRAQGHDALIEAKTGLRIDAYFSATKLRWLLDHVEGARSLAEQGELVFGTVDTWLIWQLTAGQRHVTDVTNAARTMLFNIHRHCWDDELLALFNIPKQLLPEVLPSSAEFGDIQESIAGGPMTIGGVAGDQQSALFGQACFNAGQAKNTYGTGCFMLMQTGTHAPPSQNGLITTCAAQENSEARFALEGSVFVGGSVVQWLRDGLQALESSTQIESLASQVPDTAGVVFVPAFTGLGAPYWNGHARGIITGLTRGSTMAHIARAALESIAFQSAALLQAMNKDALAIGAQAVTELRVDGGACVNDLLMQFQADLLGISVIRPKVTETTALGAAYLAGLQAGIFANTQELSQLWQVERQFDPMMSRDEAASRMSQWEQAVRQASAA